MRETHGGDWAGYQFEYGTLPLDFSASVSPLGLPEGVRRAAATALDNSHRYPDPECRALVRALSERYGVPGRRIVCGNGAADLIYRLALALRPKRALVPVPTFSEYGAALETAGCQVERFPLNETEDFVLTPALLSRITPETGLLFLCQPNNPTGRTVSPALLADILAACAETGTVLAADECFADLLDEPNRYSLTGRLGDSTNLVVIRAFTKQYAMAGLRLGYALCGSEELAESLRRSGPPWAVSAVAQAAGLAALEERDYLEELRSLIRRERPRLAAGLAALGCRVVPGEANFLLFRHRDTGLGEKLRRRGILLRECGDFPGLAPGWYRAAVRRKEENETLLRTLEEVLADG